MKLPMCRGRKSLYREIKRVRFIRRYMLRVGTCDDDTVLLEALGLEVKWWDKEKQEV